MGITLLSGYSEGISQTFQNGVNTKDLQKIESALKDSRDFSNYTGDLSFYRIGERRVIAQGTQFHEVGGTPLQEVVDLAIAQLYAQPLHRSSPRAEISSPDVPKALDTSSQEDELAEIQSKVETHSEQLKLILEFLRAQKNPDHTPFGNMPQPPRYAANPDIITPAMFRRLNSDIEDLKESVRGISDKLNSLRLSNLQSVPPLRGTPSGDIPFRSFSTSHLPPHPDTFPETSLPTTPKNPKSAQPTRKSPESTSGIAIERQSSQSSTTLTSPTASSREKRPPQQETTVDIRSSLDQLGLETLESRPGSPIHSPNTSKELASLQKRLAPLLNETNIEDLKSKIELLEKENAHLKNLFEKTKQQLATLSAQLPAQSVNPSKTPTTFGNIPFGGSLEDLSSQLDQLGNQLDEKRAELEKLNHQLNQTETALQTAQSNNSALQAALQRATDELSQLKSGNATDLLKKNAEIKTIRDDLTENTHQIKRLQDQNKVLQEELTKARQETPSLKRQLHAAQQDFGVQLELRAHERELAIGELHRLLDTQADSISKLENKLQKAATKKATLQNEIDRIKQEDSATLQSELEGLAARKETELQQSLDSQKIQLENQYQQKLQQIQAQNSTLSRRATELERDLENLKTIKDLSKNLQEEIHQLNSKNDVIKKYNTSLQRALEKAIDEKAQLDQKCQTILKTLEGVKSDLAAELQASKRQLEANLHELQQKLQSVQQTNKGLEEQLNTEQSEKIALTLSNKALETAIEDLKKQLADEQQSLEWLQKKLDEATKLLVSLSAENEDLNRSVDNHAREIEEIYSAHETTIADLRAQLANALQNQANEPIININALTEKLRAAEELANSQRNEIQSLSGQIQTQEAAVKKIQDQLARAQQDYGLQLELRDHESKLATGVLHQSLNEQSGLISSLEIQLQQATSAKTKLKTQLQTKISQIKEKAEETLQSEMEGLAAQKETALQAALDSQQVRLQNQYQQKLQDLTSKNSELSQQTTELRAKLKTLEKIEDTSKRLQQEITELKRVDTAKNLDRKFLQQKIDHLTIEKNKLDQKYQQELQELIDEKAQLTTEFQSSKQRLEGSLHPLKKSLSTLTAAQAALQDRIESEEKEKIALNRKNQALKKSNKDLKEQLEDLQEKLDEAVVLIETLSNDNSRLDEELSAFTNAEAPKEIPSSSQRSRSPIMRSQSFSAIDLHKKP